MFDPVSVAMSVTIVVISAVVVISVTVVIMVSMVSVVAAAAVVSAFATAVRETVEAIVARVVLAVVRGVRTVGEVGT